MSNLKNFPIMMVLLVALLISSPALAQEEAKAEPTPDEMVAGLEEMCARNATKHKEDPNAESLYERLGGYEKILSVTKEVIRRHLENPGLKKATFEGVDLDRLSTQVATWIAAHCGGPQEYTGKSMQESHRHLNVTNASFLAAGHDIVESMKKHGFAQAEIDEVVCLFVSFKNEVMVVNK